jgi:hypothetical protein
LKADPAFADRVINSAAKFHFEAPVCYQGYAVAHTAPDGATQPSYVLFRYDAKTGRWQPLNVGSADYCQGYVPADIASHFEGCDE